MPPSAQPPNLVKRALGRMKSGWVSVAVFSAFSNLLMLTGSLYMMQVYDRVLTSRSVATLLGVSLIALAAFAFQGILDHLRMKILGRIGSALDEDLSPLTVRAALSHKLRTHGALEGLKPFRDLDALRGFLASMGPTAIIDLPFTPIFLIVCFLLHPALGWLTLMGIVVILALTLLIDQRSMEASQAVATSGAEQFALLDAGRRNGELITAMGMSGVFAERFDHVHRRHVGDTLTLADSAGGLGSFAKVFRYVLQSAVIGLGAFLVIRGELSGGAMLAASILTSRALGPVELAVAHWKGFVAARHGYSRLKTMLPTVQQTKPGIALPDPHRSLWVEEVSIAAPQADRSFVTGVSFRLGAGEALGLIGPSGSGKSTLARALVGAWPLQRGVIRLDGADMRHWDRDELGTNIGYLPQDVELFPGTVAANIARLAADGSSQAVLAASQAAGAHEMISRLPDGYDTMVGEGGASLSGGQRQRIALARALYGDPFLVVLDEPNSSLDSEGDAALSRAISGIKARGGIAVVVTHRPSGLAAVDLVGVMTDGRLRKLGPREEVMAVAVRPESPAASARSASTDALRAVAADMRAADGTQAPTGPVARTGFGAS